SPLTAVYGRLWEPSCQCCRHYYDLRFVFGPLGPRAVSPRNRPLIPLMVSTYITGCHHRVIEDHMYIRESEWLGRRLASLPSDELFPMLDVGSSTEDYRTIQQPWIDQNIFAPIRKRGGKVYHLDMKEARGVDIVGDLLDREFLDRIAQMKVRSVM